MCVKRDEIGDASMLLFPGRCCYSSSLSAQRPALYEPPPTHPPHCQQVALRKTTASPSMIDFALHLFIFTCGLLISRLSRPRLSEETARPRLFLPPLSPVASRGCVQLHFVGVNRLAGVHRRSGYVEEMQQPAVSESRAVGV